MVAALLKPWRRRRANPALNAVLAGLAALLLLAWSGQGRAQAPIVAKTLLCEASAPACDQNSALLTVPVGLPVYFQVTVDNSGGPATKVDIDPELPAGFLLTGVVCVSMPGSVSRATPFAARVDDLDLPASGALVCRFSGFFGPGSTAVGDVEPSVYDNATGSVVSNGWNVQVRLDAIPADLEIVKTVDPISADLATGPKQVVFTILVRNLGTKDVALNGLLTVMDRLRLKAQSVVLNATFLGATCTVHVAAANVGLPPSDCLEPVPFSPSATPPPLLVASTGAAPFAGWRYRPPVAGQPPVAGLLRFGDEMELKVTVEIGAVPAASCIIAANADGLINSADLVLGLPSFPGGPAAPLAESSAGANPSANNSASAPLAATTGATVVNPHCNAPFAPVPPDPPALSITKVQITPTPSGGIPWGTPVTYRITIKNVSASRHVGAIYLSDWIREGVGTPPFIARIGVACSSPTSTGPICSKVILTTPQPFIGYSDTRPMYDAVAWHYSGGLDPNGTLILDVDVRYSSPQCDSYPSVKLKPIYNSGIVTRWLESAVNTGAGAKTVTRTLTSTVTTLMAPPPEICPLKVTKSVDPAPIEFGKPAKYTITFENPSNKSYSMGTLIDAMRFVPSPASAPAYAGLLPVAYSYSCSVDPDTGIVTGFPPNNPGGPGVTDTVIVTGTQLAQQGVRLIRNPGPGPVKFGPGSKLTCVLYVTVPAPPPENSSYCSTARLENFALLDSSALYPPNALWPDTVPGMSYSVSNDLPRCYDLKLDKTVTPSWTWAGGGPLIWKLKILNIGPAIAETTTTGPLIRDTFDTLPSTLGPVKPSASMLCPACSFVWTKPPPSPQPSVVRVVTMPKGHNLVATYTLDPAPNGTGLVCNRAAGDYAAAHPRWYWKHPNAKAAEACAKILAVGSIQVRKVVQDNSGSGSGIVLPATLPFDVTVSCTYPPDPTGVVIPDVTRTLTAAAAASLVEHVPVDSVCTVKEAPPPLPAATPKCSPVWQTAYSPSVTVAQPPATALLTITNVLTCKPSTLLIIKTIDHYGNLAPPPKFVWFLVDCGAPYVWTVKVFTNGFPKSIDVPPLASCTVIEYVPPSNTPPGVYKVLQTPSVPVTTVASGAVTVKVHNQLIYPPVTGTTLLIRKLVRINGAPTSVSPSLLPFAASFEVEVACAGHPTVRVTLDGIPNTIGTIFERAVGPYPPGTQCEIREVSRSTPHPCSWGTLYPLPQTVTIGPLLNRRDVINTVNCPP